MLPITYIHVYMRYPLHTYMYIYIYIYILYIYIYVCARITHLPLKSGIPFTHAICHWSPIWYMAERHFAQAGTFVRNFKTPTSALIDDLVVIMPSDPQEPHELGVKSASGDLVPSEFPIRFAQELRSLYPVEREESGAEGDASEPCHKRPTPQTPDHLCLCICTYIYIYIYIYHYMYNICCVIYIYIT